MTQLLEALNQSATIERLMDEAHKALLVSENETVDWLRDEYVKLMRKVILDLERINSSFLAQEAPTYSGWKQLQLDVQSAQAVAARMNGFRQEFTDTLASDIRDFYKLSYNTATWAIDQTTPVNIDPSYNLPTDNMIDLMMAEPWAGSRFSDRIWAITDQWAQQIQNQLIDSIRTGDSVQEMASSIRDFVGVPSDERLVTRPRASAQLYRATLIARTEMIRAGRDAQEKVFKDNSDLLDGGPMTNKVWSAKPGLVGVCDDCRDKDGHTPEEILEMGLDLEEHPNGRCSWIPKLKSYQDLLAPYIAKIKSMPGKIDPEAMLQPTEYGNMKPVSIEPFQEWALKNLTPNEMGDN